MQENYFTDSYEAGLIRTDNRICINPMEGSDADANGAPGVLAYRRYEKFANSLPGIIWFEATAVCLEGRASARQLLMSAENVSAFKKLVGKIKKLSPKTLVICQLTHSGRFSRPDGRSAPYAAQRDPYLDSRYPAHTAFEPVTDEYLDSLPETFLIAAQLAYEAGFDGVDIKICHKYLLSELLSAYKRTGRYGGTFEGRSKLSLDIFKRISCLKDKLILASRFGIYDAIPYPYGFGANRENAYKADFSEPVELIRRLKEYGLSMINVTMGTPYYNSYVNKPSKSELLSPEMAVSQLLDGAAQIKSYMPDITVVSTGYSYLKSDAATHGNQMLKENHADFIGFGRMAFAYPDFGKALLSGDGLDDRKCCIACNKCSEILRAGGLTGCVIFDQDIYLPEYRKLKAGLKMPESVGGKD